MPPEQNQHLTPEQVENLRRQLLDRRNEIAGDLQELSGESGKERDESPPGAVEANMPTHNAEAATDEQARQKPLQLGQMERDMVQAIDEALERIRQGTYGRCLMGDEPISLKRLQAKPWARYCLEHAEAQHG